MQRSEFDWDLRKDLINQQKHGVTFYRAQYAFADPCRVIAKDHSHWHEEDRYYCFGKLDNRVMTVRFTYRGGIIRIFGAGYWRKGKKIYETENRIYKWATG